MSKDKIREWEVEFDKRFYGYLPKYGNGDPEEIKKHFAYNSGKIKLLTTRDKMISFISEEVAKERGEILIEVLKVFALPPEDSLMIYKHYTDRTVQETIIEHFNLPKVKLKLLEGEK